MEFSLFSFLLHEADIIPSSFILQLFKLFLGLDFIVLALSQARSLHEWET